jgi:hypothetical protein
MPNKKPRPMMSAQLKGANSAGHWLLNNANDSHANRVPDVPGMIGDKPLPNPWASICAGCPSMKRAVGFLT